MVEELNNEIKTYKKEWETFYSGLGSADFFASLKPTSIGWKAVDLDDYDRRLKELRSLCDQIHIAWINERWLATLHLNDTELSWGIRIVKLMQRRPGSDDATGLDHLDFLVESKEQAKKVLEDSSSIKWTEESNNPLCSWLSVWFGNTEAKLREGTVLDVCMAELEEANHNIVAEA